MVDRVGADARRRDIGTEPVERQDRGGEQDLVAYLRDAEGAHDRGDHGRSASSTTQLPPAASIRDRALALKAWAWTVRGLVNSPLARILTGIPFLVASRCVRSCSSVTASPASKRASRSRRLTACVWVLNGSNGIDFFMCGPRNFRMRMWIGFWPPSK